MLRSSIALYKNAYTGLSPQVWLLSLVMLINRSGTMVIPFLTVYLRQELHFTISEAGIIMGFFGIGSFLGGFIGGRLSDKIGFYEVQFWSLFLSGIFFIVMSLLTNFWHIAACILMVSTIGESFRPANGAAIAYYSEPENRTRSYSLNRLAINLGFSIGPAIGGLLATISYQFLFWADGVTCIIAAFLLRFSFKPVAPVIHEKTDVKKISDSPYRDTVYLKFMFLVFMVAFCFLMLFHMVPVYYSEEVGMSPSLIGIVLAANGFLIVIFEMILVYKLEGRRNPTIYIALGTFLIGLSYLVLNIADVFSIVVLGMLIVTLGEMLMFPFINTFWVNRSADHNRGQYAAVFTMSFALAHIISPTIGSQIIKFAGYDALWYVVFFICSVAAIGFIKLKT